MKRSFLAALMGATIGALSSSRVVKHTVPRLDTPSPPRGRSSKPAQPRIGNILRAARSQAARMCFLNIRKDRLLTGYRVKDGSKFRVRFEVNRTVAGKKG